MTISKLPSGRWRARIWLNGKDVPVGQVLGGGPASFRTKGEARDAYDEARRILKRTPAEGGALTVDGFWRRWTTDRAFERPKESTNVHNRERTRAFVEKYGSLRLAEVNKRIVDDWLLGGARVGTLPALRAMFNDALRLELVDRNPFANLRISKGRGNKDVRPPSPEMVLRLLAAARRVAGPSFAAWLHVAAHTGMRPGELDALRWDAVDFEQSRVWVHEQFSSMTGRFTLPKNGKRRAAPMTPPAREALIGLPRESEFCFVNLRGRHWTAASRAYHWKATAAAAGYDGTLYLATRHYAGYYMTDVLGLAAEDVAIALGHEDGGYLVRTLYGHRDKDRALDRVVAAYEGRSNVVPLKLAEEA